MKDKLKQNLQVSSKGEESQNQIIEEKIEIIEDEKLDKSAKDFAEHVEEKTDNNSMEEELDDDVIIEEGQTSVEAVFEDNIDENGKKARKLAQENARYLISVFTPTNMVYSTSFRQLNYLCHWFEDEIKQPSNNFYASIVPSMQEFVDFCKDKNLFSDKLDDRKDRTLSLFDEPVLKTIYSSNYQGVYKMSFACLAQEQRHRTIDYSINKFTFVNDFSKITEFYIPPIIAGNERLRDEYLKDIATVAEFLPQGTLLDVSEAGSYKNFILKAKERLCACAQKEIRDLTLVQTKEYANALDDEAETFASEETRKQARRMSNKLTSMSNGSRCRAGYKCKSPCGFIDGINLESLV